MNLKYFFAVIVAVIFGFSGCSVSDASVAPKVEKKAKWALLPIINQTETPQAGLRAEAITESMLRVEGLSVVRYTSAQNRDGVFDASEEKLMNNAISWAKENGFRYAVTGVVDEWRYKVGIDGEPAVGITLKIIDLSNDEVIWSAAGARAGWSRESVSGVAQKLISNLIEKAKLD
jgi:polysaccharide biosynthesis protein PelC